MIAATRLAAALIGHKDLRMPHRYTNLEDWLDNPAQKLLAEHYKKTKKRERTQSGHKPVSHPQTKKDLG
jgi:hypothetical protein